MFQKILFSIVLSTLFMVTSCTDKKQQQFDTTTAKANKLLLEKKYKEALVFYEKALKLMPKDVDTKKNINVIKEIILKQDEENFNLLISKADALFQQKDYVGAKQAYEEAAAIKPEDTLIAEEILNLKTLIADNTVSTETVVDNSATPYHVIVGSYERESNAITMQEKLIAQGYNSKLISRPNGFTAVSLSSHSNIHEAYNNLNKGVEYHVNVWVIKSE